MNEEPLIGVIVPAYNAEATIAETLTSVLKQQYSNLEVLVVDDGSTDSTADIVRAFAAKDHRVILKHQVNSGVAAARNCGIMASRAEFIAPVDADDVWHCETIAKGMAVMLSAGEQLGFVYAWCRFIDERGCVISDGPRYALRGRILHRHLLVNCVCNGSGLLMRRSAALAAGMYDLRPRREGMEGCEDWLLQLRIASKYPVDLLPECLVGYRIRRNCMSSNRVRMALGAIAAVKQVLDEHPGIPRKLHRWALGPRYLKYSFALARERRPLSAICAFKTALALDPQSSIAAWTAAPMLFTGLLRIPFGSETTSQAFHEMAPSAMLESPRTMLDTLRDSRLKKLQMLDEGARSMGTPTNFVREF